MTRADLHRLVDELPDGAIDVVAVYLERAKEDQVTAALAAAPLDDEPFTDVERAAVEDALADPTPSVPWEAAKRTLAAD